MKYISISIRDDETGITAEISPTSISIGNSKINSSFGYAHNKSQNKVFVFQGSKPETVKQMAEAFLRVYKAQQELIPSDF